MGTKLKWLNQEKNKGDQGRDVICSKKKMQN